MLQLSREKKQKSFQDPKNLLPTEISDVEISTVLLARFRLISAFLRPFFGNYRPLGQILVQAHRESVMGYRKDSLVTPGVPQFALRKIHGHI